MTRYEPADDLARRHPDVRVAAAALAPVRGAWIPSERVVLIDETLEPGERRCVLAHEVAHIDLGHRPSRLGWFQRRHESDADDLAARRLVSTAELGEALRWCLCDEELADHLDVTLDVVRLRLAMLDDNEKAFIDTLIWGKTA